MPGEGIARRRTSPRSAAEIPAGADCTASARSSGSKGRERPLDRHPTRDAVLRRVDASALPDAVDGLVDVEDPVIAVHRGERETFELARAGVGVDGEREQAPPP